MSQYLWVKVRAKMVYRLFGIFAGKIQDNINKGQEYPLFLLIFLKVVAQHLRLGYAQRKSAAE